MNPSENLIEFVKKWEGCELKAYQDPVGIWTIGYGSIVYHGGTRVNEGDVITQSQADELLMYQLTIKAASVMDFTRNVKLNQNQFDALTDFAYNEGVGALKESTLLKLVRLDPKHPGITNAFLMWNKITVNGKKVISNGVANRRRAEADLYFS
jgi:lysozyme